MNLYCAVDGLKPCYDEDYDEKKKLKVGQVYSCEIRMMRNYRFHKKYHSLINTAWAFQSEEREAFFHKDVNSFRKTVEIAAGNCERVYNVSRKEWMDIPKSIAFDKMDETEFQSLYERVKDVLFTVFLTHISEEDFMKHLNNY